MRKNKYLEIFSNLGKEPSVERNLNTKILLIDGLNTFIRSFAIDTTLNDNGIHIGGITGFLKSIGFAIRTLKPTRTIIIFDGPGGSIRRKSIFPEYKGNRKSSTRISKLDMYSDYNVERESVNYQIKRLSEYLSYLPVQTLIMRDVEADDVIAYLANNVFKESKCVIMSTDSDFIQLVNENISIWSPTRKQYYTSDSIIEDYEISPINFLLYKSLIGDKSDNIPGIRGVGLGVIKKRLPIFLENKKISLDDIYIYIQNKLNEVDKKGRVVNDYKVYHEIINNKDIILRNYELIRLDDSTITDNKKILITNQLQQPINRLLKFKLLALMLEDSLHIGIKNPDIWVRETFFDLDKQSEITRLCDNDKQT